MIEEQRTLLESVARRFGTPCYVYFVDEVRERVADLTDCFEGLFLISYAVKSNPNTGLLRRMSGVVNRLDVSSAGEVVRALRAGWEATALSFTGPGKTQAELSFAVDVGVGEIVLESLDEATIVAELARQRGKKQAVLLRVSPQTVPRGFGLTMGGKASPFGIDQEELDEVVDLVASSPYLKLDGFHVFAGSQCLKVAPLAELYRSLADLFRRICEHYQLAPRTFVFGSGLGVVYHAEDSPLDLQALAQAVLPALRLFASWAHSRREDASLVLETGRYLVGEAGVYLVGVTRLKRSRGQNIAICDGGMHHQLTAAGHLGAVVPRNFRIAKITPTPAPVEEDTYTLVGPLCTALDTFGRDVRLPRLSSGDVVGILSSGAYGLTASPVHFISHPPPREIIVESFAGETRITDESDLHPLWWPSTGGKVWLPSLHSRSD